MKLSKIQRDAEALRILEDTEDRIRGSYLRVIEHVEFLVCEILATHFFFDGRDGGQTRRMDLLHIILRRANLRFSIEALRYVLEGRYPALWDKYSKTIRSLERMLAHRNLLVHSTLAISDQVLPKDVGTSRSTVFESPSSIELIGFSRGRVRFRTITVKDHKADLKKAGHVCNELMELWREILARKEIEAQGRANPQMDGSNSERSEK